jgi:hypothetical protein
MAYLKTINDIKAYIYGEVFVLESKDFGIHTFLVAKYPAKLYINSTIFVDVENSSVIYYDSVKNDTILKRYKNLKEYQEQYAQERVLEELILFNNKLLKRLKCMSPEHYSILKEIIFENQERMNEIKEVKQP